MNVHCSRVFSSHVKISFPLDHMEERSMANKAQVVANTLSADYFYPLGVDGRDLV